MRASAGHDVPPLIGWRDPAHDYHRPVHDLVAGAVKVAAAARDIVVRPPEGITVLIYHRVGGPGGAVDLDPGRFDAQMAELAASGQVRTLDRAVDEATGDAPFDGGSVTVTFDDGTGDFVDHAVPILAEHRVPATIYVATRFVDEGIDFPGGGPAVSWAGLRDACSTGLITVGSHTHGHALLDRITAAQVAEELDRSIELIGEHLGAAPAHFAYPKAVLGSTAAQAEVATRFRSAAIAGTKANPPGLTDPQQLARSPIQVADGMRFFRRKARGGLGLEDELRRRVNRRRYAGAST